MPEENPTKLAKVLRAALPFLFAYRAESAAAPLTDVFKTERVVATIRHNETMGDFVMFSFPKNPYDCDRAEIFDFINSDEIGGSTFQGGGAAGAPIFARFPKAKKREQLRDALKSLTPKLDALMRDITNDVPVPKPPPRKIMDKRGKEWPECVPPDPSDPRSKFNNNLNVNGTAYYCTAEGRWAIDEKVMEWKRDHQRSRGDLLAALTRRKLTHEELMRIEPLLNTREMEPYFAAVKYAEMYDLLVTQWELQTGVPLPFKTPLSRALGQYNRAPQEQDNRRAVEEMIAKLQALSGERKADEE